MSSRGIQMHLGVGAIIASLLFVLVLIPNFVTSPSNVRKVVLSPVFWPNSIALFLGLTGVALVIVALGSPKQDAPANSDVDDPGKAFLRLLGIALTMIVTVIAMPVLGLVWTAMLTFAATAFLVHTKHPMTAILSAVVFPLLLYFFFAHVAGVAIPQGDFVRLP